MTFDAMSAWMAFALLGGVGAAAAWLFLRKLRPPRKPIASLLLWRRVLDEARELTLWERIRRTVSLIVTVAIALILALAVTRPALRSGAPSVSGGRTLIVIDSSWSMATRMASGGSRWDRALQEARRLAEGADDEVALATTADGLVAGPTTDSTLIVNALKGLSAGGGDAASWPQLAGSDSVHFITDGAVAHPVTDGAVAHPVAAGVVVHSVFEGSGRPPCARGREHQRCLSRDRQLRPVLADSPPHAHPRQYVDPRSRPESGCRRDAAAGNSSRRRDRSRSARARRCTPKRAPSGR